MRVWWAITYFASAVICASFAQPAKSFLCLNCFFPGDDPPEYSFVELNSFAPANLDNARACVPNAPNAPAEARTAGIAQVTALIDETGRARDAVIVRSSGYEDLDRSLIDAIDTCRFTPATIGENPTALAVTINYKFYERLPPFWLPPYSDYASGQELYTNDTELPPPIGLEPKIPKGSPCPRIDYPKLSKELNEAGWVIATYVVAADGRIAGISLQGPGRQDTRLIEALENGALACRFQPATFRGHAVAVYKEVRYRFRTNE